MLIVTENTRSVNTAKNCSKEEVIRKTYVSYSRNPAFSFRNYDTCINYEYDIYAKMQVFLWFSILITLHRYFIREKGKDLTKSYDKTPTEKSKKQRDNTKTLPEFRLHNDCGPT